jgi:GTP:adenosylcobinamide-phosphate guanylyltransferase
MQLLIPAAGLGSRFTTAGYTTPKPLLPVDGVPMIRRVVDDCVAAFGQFSRITIAVSSPRLESFKNALRGMDIHFVLIDELTRGAAETALFCREHCLAEQPLVVANSDQVFSVHSRVDTATNGCLVFPNDGQTKWSFVREGKVIEKPPSVFVDDVPTCGVYWWKSSQEFFDAAADAIASDERHGPNQEFYIAPLLNRSTFRVEQVRHFAGLGTPEDYQTYLSSRSK